MTTSSLDNISHFLKQLCNSIILFYELQQYPTKFWWVLGLIESKNKLNEVLTEGRELSVTV